MPEISLAFLNKLASHLITISSLLGGFSITVITSLLIYDTNNRFVTYMLKAATVAAACFLATVFMMTEIFMMTTEDFPRKVVAADFLFNRIIGILTFFAGIIALAVVIGLSGWTKSKSLGRFTTAIVVFMLLLILTTMVQCG